MKSFFAKFTQLITTQTKKSSSLLDNSISFSFFKKPFKIVLFSILILAIFSQETLLASWYDQKLEGWYYFEDPEAPISDTLSITPQQAEDLISLESKRLKQLLSLAIISPTDENVKIYIEAQRKWISQSNLFAQTWGKTLLNHPEIGDFLTTPTSSYGILTKKSHDLETRKELLHKLSKDYFLLFFFKSTDPYSEKVVEVVQLFATTNNWKYKAVSLDGHGLRNLPAFEADKGISAYFGLQVTPSIFIVNPTDNQAYPVGAGLVTVSEIEQNIETQVRTY